MNFPDLIVVREPIFGEYKSMGLEVAVGVNVDGNAIGEEFDAIGLKYEVINNSIMRVDPYGFCVTHDELMQLIKPILSKYGAVEVRIAD